MYLGPMRTAWGDKRLDANCCLYVGVQPLIPPGRVTGQHHRAEELIQISTLSMSRVLPSLAAASTTSGSRAEGWAAEGSRRSLRRRTAT